jgi:hypothetical protein
VPDQRWAMLPRDRSKPSSKVWIRISKAWRLMMNELTLCDPTNFYTVLHQGLWFEDSLRLIGSHLSKERAAELFRAGMRTVQDVWCVDTSQLLDWDEITQKFLLNPEERPLWRHITNVFPHDWSCKLWIGPLPLRKGEWARLYKDD